MANQTSKRNVRHVKFTTKDLPASAATYYQGSLICWDTSVGRVVKGAASTTLRPIGVAAEDKVIGSNGDPLSVNLFREVTAYWFANLGAAPVLAANRGQLCFIADDQSVRVDDNTNTCSVAGLVWDVDATKGVLVEPRFVADRATTTPGLDT